MFHSLSRNTIGAHWDGSQRKWVSTPEGPLAIAEALRVNAVVTSIDVGLNWLDEETALSIVRAVRQRDIMTTLGLAMCGISAVGAKELAEYISGSAVVTKLDIRYNR